MLAQLLEKHGLRARVVSADAIAISNISRLETFALHRRRCRVLELEPVPRAALTYGEPSRFDAMPSFEGAMADRLPKCQS